MADQSTNSDSLWGSLLVAAASSAANSASNSVNNAEQWEYQQKQNQWNAEQASIAYQRQLDFWDKQNQYNAPAQQIARLREAGINPNLAYANGSLNNVNQNTPSVNSSEAQLTGNYKGMDFSTIPTTFVDTYIKNEQLKQIKAQTDKVQKENEYQGITNQIKLATWLDEVHSLQHKYRSNSRLEDLADEALEQARIQSSQMRNDLSFSQRTLEGRVSAVELQNEATRLSNNLNRIAYNINKEKVPFARKMAYLEFKSSLESIVTMHSQGILNRAAANAAFSQAILNSEFAKNQQFVRDGLDSQMRLNDAKTFNTYQDTSNKMVSGKRAKTEYDFDFDNPLYDKDGHINWKVVGKVASSILDKAVSVGSAAIGAMAF